VCLYSKENSFVKLYILSSVTITMGLFGGHTISMVHCHYEGHTLVCKRIKRTLSGFSRVSEQACMHVCLQTV